MVVSTCPDVCLTPAGPAQVPVPYPITATFEDSTGTSPNVRFGGDPAFICEQSAISKVTGDEAGTSKGIISKTTGGKAEPIKGSSTVKVNGKAVVRNGDPFKMNNGNTIGVVIYQPGSVPSGGFTEQGEPSEEPPPPEPEREEEKGFLGGMAAWAKDAAIGAAKGLVNTVPIVGELLLNAGAQAGAVQLEAASAMSPIGSGPEKAQEPPPPESIELPKFEMENAAQEQGDMLVTGIQMAMGGVGFLKGAAKAGLKSGAKNLVKATRKKAGKKAAKKTPKAPKVSSGGDGVRVTAKRLSYAKDFKRERLNFKKIEEEFDGVLQEDLRIVQYHNGNKLGDGHSAKWWTSTSQANAFRNADDVHDKLALLPKWGKRDHVSIAVIPKGERVTFVRGLANAQRDRATGKIYRGGGEQFLFKNFDPSWIKTTGKIK